VRLGIKSRPQASLLWQMDIEFHQCAFGVAKLDWLKTPRRSEIGLLDCFISKIWCLCRCLVCTGRKLIRSDPIIVKLLNEAFGKELIWTIKIGCLARAFGSHTHE
jgi:hypothetical protein